MLPGRSNPASFNICFAYVLEFGPAYALYSWI